MRWLGWPPLVRNNGFTIWNGNDSGRDWMRRNGLPKYLAQPSRLYFRTGCAVSNVPTITPAFLRPEDAARYLSISRRCLTELSRKGILRPAHVSHKLTLYAVADLTAAIMRLRSPGNGVRP